MIKLFIVIFYYQLTCNKASCLDSAVTATEHGALDVQVSVTGGVSAEQPGLESVIHHQPVAVAEPQVAVLVPDGPVTVSAALVIHSDPVRPVLTISDDALDITLMRSKGSLH